MSLKALLVFNSVILFLSLEGYSQSISGNVLDDKKTPVPFANILVRELENGVTADARGHFYLTLDPGIYTFLISSVGYKTQIIQVIISDKALKKDFILQTDNIELNEIIISSKRKDPAYEIIRNTIKNKDKFLEEVQSYRANIYVKASEVMDKKEKKKSTEEDDPKENKSVPSMNEFSDERKKQIAHLESINLLEMQLTLNYKFPKYFKEERTGYKLYGNKEGLFIPIFNEVNINFYENLVNLRGISEVPVISPLSKTSILSYKYKLEETLKEGKQTVFKIKVIPRKSGDATVKGFLYINDSSWNINRLELTLYKGGLKFYDVFSIKQTYRKFEGEHWFPFRQEFDYETKAGRKTFKGNTVLVYSEYQKNYPFPPRFFGNEVSVITQEAYERDSSYWKEKRIEPLTEEQKKVINYRDSIERAHKDQHYLDSIQAKYNKITLGEALYHGIGFRNEAKKRSVYLAPLLGLIGFEVIGGFRLGPFASYFKKYKSGRILYTSGSLNMGFKNADLQGNLNIWTRYNPIKQGDISIRGGRSFYSVNSFDAYLNQLRISNYILHDHIDLGHRIELFNGFYVNTELQFHDRKSISGYDRTSILNEVIKEDDPLYFTDYQALISNLKFSYTPFQRYMTEPTQKIILGSKYPTFSFSYKKGWKDVLTSDVDFDYIDFSIEQNLILGVLGNSKYTLAAGKFINTRDLRYVDLKRFRQSDPYLYSDPLHSFQQLDTSLVAKDWFFEAHFIHHFNGAMINNLPLIKKTKIRTVAGAGFMYILESNYRHQEVFGGIERIFKIGARRRLRIGLFGVVSQSNQSPLVTGYKISLDLIDSWKKDWSY